MRILAHTALIAAVLTVGSLAAVSATASPKVGNVAIVDHHAVHACYARAYHQLKRQGARVTSVSQELQVRRVDDAWNITGDLNTASVDGPAIYHVACAVGPGGIQLDVVADANSA